MTRTRTYTSFQSVSLFPVTNLIGGVIEKEYINVSIYYTMSLKSSILEITFRKSSTIWCLFDLTRP